FDVPYAEGMDLTRSPLHERKEYLERLIAAAPAVAPTVQYCEHIVGHGQFVFERAAAFGLEGIVSKRIDARYVSKRTDSWLKIKCTDRQEFVVGGYTRPGGSGVGFGALLLGAYEPDGGLRYCGRVGTGFTDAVRTELGAALQQLECADAPFRDPESDPDARWARWVRPVLVAEVEFTGWTHEGALRHPTFRGLRSDKSPAEVELDRPPPKVSAPLKPESAGRTVVQPAVAPEDATIGGIRISNPGRTVYPEARVTKQQVAEYYLAVADWILPYVTRRPLSLVRCPLGLAGESFYQRHVLEGFPDAIRGIPANAEIEGEPYLVIDDRAGLLSLVQMGVLEIHTWGCREDDLERPDHLIFDLDPGPGLVWEHIVASAHFVRAYLESLGLQSFVKTSGGKGIHVVVPIVRRTGWEQVKAFTAAVARDIVRAAPQNFVASMAKSVREHRVFVDYLRNVRGSTAVAVYSTRARPGALVSTPLGWEELTPEQTPDRFTVKTVPRRLARLEEDPWLDFRSIRQSITKSMRDAVGLRT
ncbi:MAG: DNA ligase D, partial [Planctomycetota bacterium]